MGSCAGIAGDAWLMQSPRGARINNPRRFCVGWKNEKKNRGVTPSLFYERYSAI